MAERSSADENQDWFTTMIVMKFGGTSVQDAAAIRNAEEIIRGRLSRNPVVVVSAMAGVTDALLRIAKVAEQRNQDQAISLVDELRKRHIATARELLDPRETASSQTGVPTDVVIQRVEGE